MSCEPHVQRIKKSDPVSRYQSYRHSWDACRAPGEKAHKHLRWGVREKMLYHDQVLDKVLEMQTFNRLFTLQWSFSRLPWFSALTRLGIRKSIRPVKTEWWGAGVVICLQRHASDLHMVQLMPLPLHISCFIKIQIGLTFLEPAYLGSPRKKAGLKRGPSVQFNLGFLSALVRKRFLRAWQVGAVYQRWVAN